jgi:hypothetical protein
MLTNPRRTPNRSIAVLATACVVLAGGCNVKPIQPIQTPTFSPSTTSTTPPPPVKYSATGWKGCSDIQEKLSDLPPLRREDKPEGFKWSGRSCNFKSGDSSIVLYIQYWETTEDINGVHPGAERAKKDFREPENAGEKDSSVHLGSDVRWKPDDTTGCTLEILDENAVVSADSGNGKFVTDGNIEQCRGPVRELARQFYAAVQPQ